MSRRLREPVGQLAARRATARWSTRGRSTSGRLPRRARRCRRRPSPASGVLPGAGPAPLHELGGIVRLGERVRIDHPHVRRRDRASSVVDGRAKRRPAGVIVVEGERDGARRRDRPPVTLGASLRRRPSVRCSTDALAPALLPSETSTNTTSGRSFWASLSASALVVATPAMVRPYRSSSVRAASRKVRLSSPMRQRTGTLLSVAENAASRIEAGRNREVLLPGRQNPCWPRCHQAQSSRSLSRTAHLDTGGDNDGADRDVRRRAQR
jgi:hypothetical protein